MPVDANREGDTDTGVEFLERVILPLGGKA
jgi:hypothetical protein